LIFLREVKKYQYNKKSSSYFEFQDRNAKTTQQQYFSLFSKEFPKL